MIAKKTIKLVGLCCLTMLLSIASMEAQNRLYPKKRGSKYIYVDQKGRRALPENYSKAFAFHRGLAVVGKGDKRGCINLKGEVVIPIIYDKVGAFYEPVSFAAMDGQYFLIDQMGEKQSAPMDSIYNGGQGFILRHEGLYGFADVEGKILFEPQYENIDIAYKGEVPIFADGKWGSWKNGAADWEDESLYFSKPEVQPIYGEVCLMEADLKAQNQCSQKALLVQVYSNIKYPPLARKNGIQGTVVVRFIVDQEGVVQEPQIVRDIGGGCGRESLRMVGLLKTWAGAGKQNGEAVNTIIYLPIKFKLE